MQRHGIALPASLCLVMLCCGACAQRDSQQKPEATRTGNHAIETAFDPSRTLKLRGALRDHDGKRLSGVVGVLFAVYEQQEGGGPVWQEVQNVELNDRGRFTVVLGSSKSEGIPPELFGAEKTLWLGKQILLPNEVEQPRMPLLTSDDGLMAQTVIAPVTPEKPTDQASATGIQQPSAETAGPQQASSEQDRATEQGLRPRRGRRGLRRSAP